MMNLNIIYILITFVVIIIIYLIFRKITMGSYEHYVKSLCPSCLKSTGDKDEYCRNCGIKLEKEEEEKPKQKDRKWLALVIPVIAIIVMLILLYIKKPEVFKQLIESIF